MSRIFNEALSNMVTDAAAGGAVRHLTDMGLSVTEIVTRLDYPLPKETVSHMVWKHLTGNGTIRLDNPEESGSLQKVSYVTEYDTYGRRSYRRVTEKIENNNEYVKCDFGRLLYRYRGKEDILVKGLRKSDSEYLLDLPWPLEPVYHIKDERITRIIQGLTLQ